MDDGSVRNTGSDDTLAITPCFNPSYMDDGSVRKEVDEGRKKYNYVSILLIWMMGQ